MMKKASLDKIKKKRKVPKPFRPVDVWMNGDVLEFVKEVATACHTSKDIVINMLLYIEMRRDQEWKKRK